LIVPKICYLKIHGATEGCQLASAGVMTASTYPAEMGYSGPCPIERRSKLVIFFSHISV
jgi:hypothetical protein